MPIPLIPIPEDSKCQEASVLSRFDYIPCGHPAVAIVYHRRDRRAYLMCHPCADHNVRNRCGMVASAATPELYEELLKGER